MSDLERITGLISDIYDAALDASLWPQVLQRAMTLLDGIPADILPDMLLVPHFKRALAIAHALERSESKSAALGEVLERLSSAVVFVDREGRLVHANASAEQILAMSDVLNWSGGKPRPRDERAAAQLDTILASARCSRACVSCCVLSISQCTQSGARVTVHVLPLSSVTGRHATTSCAAAAAIVVSQQAWDLPQRLQSAARLYALTPAEARVVAVLLTGCTVGGTAKALGIKEATVKTHLQHVFDKTGTRRQVDLAQRIADCGRSSPTPGEISTRPSTLEQQMGDI